MINAGTTFEPIAQDPIDAPLPGEQPEAVTPETVVLSREDMLRGLLSWAQQFITRAKAWRRSSYETDWAKWQRSADGVFDPEVAKRKEPWQSKAVWPMTASHRENAQAQLFKTEVGPRPPIDVKARKGIVPQNVPGADQSDNISDLVLREREKAEYEINRNDVLEDKTTYGSGFAQIYFHTVIEDRLVWEQILEDVVSPEQDGGASVQRSMTGQLQPIGRKQVVKPQVIYRGVRFRHISIWDVFPDPQALKIKGNPIAIRYKTTYEDILNGAKPTPEGKPGYVLPEAIEALKSVPSNESIPIDKQTTQSDRHIVEGKIERTDHSRIFECYEIQARLPKKWVLINGEEIDDPEALMPARVRFHDTTVISVYPNESYDGEPDLYKDDYMPVAGQFYGRGIPEMLKDAQAVATETVNQRLDGGAISLKKVFAVIEKSLVDSKDLDNWMDGSAIRLKAKDGLTNIDQLFKQIEMSPPARESFIESQEWERAAQERTSVTATTLGTEDNQNTTLGAQRIQQGVTGLKIAYLGMLSEFGAQREYFKAFLKLIYQNYSPEDYALALGPERAQTVQMPTPEQFDNAYSYTPLGIFEQENKAQRQAQLAGWDQQFGMAPWANRVEIAKEELRSMDIDSDRFIIPEAEAVQIMEKASMLAQQQVAQIAAAQTPKPGQESGGPPK